MKSAIAPGGDADKIGSNSWRNKKAAGQNDEQPF